LMTGSTPVIACQKRVVRNESDNFSRGNMGKRKRRKRIRSDKGIISHSSVPSSRRAGTTGEGESLDNQKRAKITRVTRADEKKKLRDVQKPIRSWVLKEMPQAKGAFKKGRHRRVQMKM